jgi:Domain of unknown function (DUF4055)
MKPATSATASLEFAHPDYGIAMIEWQTVDDVCSGPACVKTRGTTYLPKLSGQTDEEYDAYRKRAVMFNVTKRTREALSGLLLRKQPILSLPDGDAVTQPLLADVTMTGMSLIQWVRHVSTAVVGTGRMVSIIDYNPDMARPYIATYKATDVLNWATGLVMGRRVLTMLIVRESEEVLEGFRVTKRERYRSYRLVDGQVLYRTWTEGDEKGHDAAVDEPMTRRGKSLPRIPAVFHNASHLGCEIGEVPLFDLADINLSHYRTSADLETGRHIAGLPTPWATGVDDDKTELTLGTTKLMTCSSAEAKFGFLEFTGQGLGELTKAMEEKERQMAVLGARLLFDAKKDAESFDTVRLRAASEGAALGNIAGHLTVTTSETLQWFYWWQGNQADPSEILATCVVNQDFVDVQMDAATLQALVSAFQQNAISFDTFFYQLQRGEVYPDGWDHESEAAAIGQRPPSTMPIPPPAPTGSGNPSKKPEPGKSGTKSEITTAKA